MTRGLNSRPLRVVALPITHWGCRQSRDRAIDDELHGERGENDAEQPRQHDVSGDAEEARKALGQKEHEGAASEHGTDERDEDGEKARIRTRAAGEQDRGRDRAGPREQRHGERESRDIADAIDGDRALRRMGLALAAGLKHHFEGNPEQQHAASDAKSGQTDPEKPQDFPASKREEGQDRKGDETGPERHLAAFPHPPFLASAPRNIGARPGGSSVTSKVASAEAVKSRIIGRRRFRRIHNGILAQSH